MKLPVFRINAVGRLIGTALSLGLVLLFLVQPLASYAQDLSTDTMRIATTWQKEGASSWAEGEAYWNNLSPNEQAKVAKLMTKVVVSDPVMAEATSIMAAGCNSVIVSRSFSWAFGTIYGGKVFHTVKWCYDGSGSGYITSNSCIGGHDQVFPWSFSGWSRYCELQSGGNGAQHVTRATQGGFSSTHGTSSYPCVGTTGDGFGNYRHFSC